MFVIVGLGNPGPRYRDTRHNAGAWVLARLWDTLGADTSRAHGCLLGRGRRGPGDVVLVRPLSYMNVSGFPVARVMESLFAELPIERLMVVHDDMDLPVGRMRVRPGGTSGGHRGVDSIIYHLRDDGFGRLKIGIDRPGEGEDPAGYVLLRPTRVQVDVLEEVVEAAAGAALCVVESGYEEAMNLYNGRVWGP